MPKKSREQPQLRFHKTWLWSGWGIAVIIIFLSLYPHQFSSVGNVLDKLEHVLAYAVLMLWFANLHLSRIPRLGYAIGFLAMGIALEFIQRWTGYRSFEVADMLADALGIITGWLLSPPRLPSLLLFLERALSLASKD